MEIINTYAIHVEKLNDEYREVFKKVSDYVTSNNMDEMRTEEILSEVMDNFLSAQEEGKSVVQVVGKNQQKFCEQLCSEKGFKTHFIHFIEGFHSCFVVYLMLNLFDFIDMIIRLSEGEKINFFTYHSRTEIVSFLCGWLIFISACYAANYFRKKYVFTSIKRYKLISGIIFAFALVFTFALVVFLLEDYDSENTYLWIGFLVCAVYLIFYHIITKDKRRFKKENRITLNEFIGVSETVRNDMEEMEMKRFEKMNKRNVKKGKPELTFEQFLDFEEKECNKWDKQPTFYIALAIGFPILVTAVLRLMNDFEHSYDMCFFFFLLLAVESLVIFGIYKAGKSGNEARLNWIKSKRENNLQ